MLINCLEKQKTLYETRILKRMCEPEFIASDHVRDQLNYPLLLYGEWYEDNLLEGFNWLSTIAYDLSYPCIVFPPFISGSLDRILELKVGLEVFSLNTNNITLVGDELNLERDVFRIQVDYGFKGPAGRSIVVSQNKETVVTIVQPKSNNTPLVLCGLRILSTSGLSDENDRQEFFSTLIQWAQSHKNEPQTVKESSVDPGRDISPEILKSVMLILAVEKSIAPADLSSLANAIFGINLGDVKIDSCVHRLTELDLATVDQGIIHAQADKLDDYLQEAGLWSYARILRADRK